MKYLFRFSVGDIVGKEQGFSRRETVSQKSPLTLEDDTEVKNLEFTVNLMKMDREINAAIEHLSATLSFRCSRCLRNFEDRIEVAHAERQFAIRPQDGRFLEPGGDSCEVDRKHQEIDVEDVLRQEILLHFPPIPVCSKSCQGLCSSCGTDLNMEAHKAFCLHSI